MASEADARVHWPTSESATKNRDCLDVRGLAEEINGGYALERKASLDEQRRVAGLGRWVTTHQHKTLRPGAIDNANASPIKAASCRVGYNGCGWLRHPPLKS